MEFEERLTKLETEQDWNAVLEIIEQGIAEASDAETQAELHLRLGRVLSQKFLQGVKALKHFQDAFKLNPALAEALVEARKIYWDLGKLAMVQKLLELQLKNGVDGGAAALRDLGDVSADLGDRERAN